MIRGYFGIGIYHTKTETNIGTLWRSALLYNADFIFTIAKRYKKQASDTLKTPKHIPLFHFKDFDDFNNHRPMESRLIAIENCEKSQNLKEYEHVDQSIYILGSEDNGLPREILYKCNDIIQIDTPQEWPLNVAVAGSIVLFDRYSKTGFKQ